MTTKHIATVEDTTSVLIPVRPCHRPRILVVEKEDDLRQLNAEVLLDAGYQVDTTEDGETAWLALQRQRYDLLVTDQFLPEAPLVELITKMHTAQRSLPVLMVTDILPLWELALHPCFATVKILRKPYTIEKLLGLVKHALSETAVVPGKFAPLTISQSQRAATSVRPC